MQRPQTGPEPPNSSRWPRGLAPSGRVGPSVSGSNKSRSALEKGWRDCSRRKKTTNVKTRQRLMASVSGMTAMWERVARLDYTAAGGEGSAFFAQDGSEFGAERPHRRRVAKKSPRSDGLRKFCAFIGRSGPPGGAGLRLEQPPVTDRRQPWLLDQLLH